MISKEMWEKLDQNALKKEEIKRPSLTYWTDAFSRLRKNRLSMISLIFLVILIIAVIIIPLFWNDSYSDQHLTFQTIGPTFEVYDVGSENYVYINKDFSIILVKPDGTLLSQPKEQVKSAITKTTTYTLDGKDIVVDWGIRAKALKKYKELEKKAKTDPTIDLVAAKKEYDSTPSYKIMLDGAELNETKSLFNKTFIFGTDSLGRDLFIRVIYGGRISLLVAFSAAIINLIIGIIYGGIAGYCGGKIDDVMMRFVDAISTIPLILYVIVLMVVLEPSLGTIILALSLTYWVGMARIVRAQVLSLKEQEFILAAKIIGAKTPRILFRHIIPNSMGPIMVSLTMQIPTAIFTEAFLSFIGIGVSVPIPSWGTLANEGRWVLSSTPYIMIFPVLFMSITLLAFNLLGDGLRDALDPRLRK